VKSFKGRSLRPQGPVSTRPGSPIRKKKQTRKLSNIKLKLKRKGKKIVLMRKKNTLKIVKMIIIIKKYIHVLNKMKGYIIIKRNVNADK